MKRTFLGATAAALLFTASPVLADPTGLDSSLCAADGSKSSISAVALLRDELAKHPLSDQYRDIDGDGVITPQESYAAIVASQDLSYLKDRDRRDKTKFSPSDDGNANAIYVYFARMVSPDLAGGQFVAFDDKAHPIPGAGDDAHPVPPGQERILKGVRLLQYWAAGDDIRIQCLGAPPAHVAAQPSPFSNLRIRGNADDLLLAAMPGAPVVGGPPGTSSTAFSWQRDELAKASTLKVQGAAGLRFVVSDDPFSTLEAVMPYVSVNRVNSDDPKKVSQNVNNLAAGFGVTGVFGSEQSDAALLWQIRPEYDTDDSFRSSIGYASARLDLAYLRNGFCFENSKPVAMFRLSCDVAALADAAQVFDDGGLAAAKSVHSYQRLGFFGGIVLSGDPDSDFWHPISLVADYKRLIDYSGNRQNLGRFEGQIVYKISPPKPATATNPALNFQIALQYLDGRADVTRQRERQWLLSLGVQY